MESAFFILVGGDETHLPHPRRSLYTPPVDTPAPAHPERRHTTGSRADRARYRADHARQGTHARTLDTLHRSALDTRQAARGRSVRRRCWRAGSVSETVQIGTQRSGSKIYLIFEYICCACNRKPLYSVSKVRYYNVTRLRHNTTTKQEGKNHENQR